MKRINFLLMLILLLSACNQNELTNSTWKECYTSDCDSNSYNLFHFRSNSRLYEYYVSQGKIECNFDSYNYFHTEKGILTFKGKQFINKNGQLYDEKGFQTYKKVENSIIDCSESSENNGSSAALGEDKVKAVFNAASNGNIDLLRDILSSDSKSRIERLSQELFGVYGELAILKEKLRREHRRTMDGTEDVDIQNIVDLIPDRKFYAKHSLDLEGFIRFMFKESDSVLNKLESRIESAPKNSLDHKIFSDFKAFFEVLSDFSEVQLEFNNLFMNLPYDVAATDSELRYPNIVNVSFLVNFDSKDFRNIANLLNNLDLQLNKTENELDAKLQTTTAKRVLNETWKIIKKRIAKESKKLEYENYDYKIYTIEVRKENDNWRVELPDSLCNMVFSILLVNAINNEMSSINTWFSTKLIQSMLAILCAIIIINAFIYLFRKGDPNMIVERLKNSVLRFLPVLKKNRLIESLTIVRKKSELDKSISNLDNLLANLYSAKDLLSERAFTNKENEYKEKISILNLERNGVINKISQLKGSLEIEEKQLNDEFASILNDHKDLIELKKAGAINSSEFHKKEIKIKRQKAKLTKTKKYNNAILAVLDPSKRDELRDQFSETGSQVVSSIKKLGESAVDVIDSSRAKASELQENISKKMKKPIIFILFLFLVAFSLIFVIEFTETGSSYYHSIKKYTTDKYNGLFLKNREENVKTDINIEKNLEQIEKDDLFRIDENTPVKYVAAGSLVIRQNQSLNSARLGLIPFGTRLTNPIKGNPDRIGKSNDYWYTADQIYGYVYGGFLSDTVPSRKDSLSLKKTDDFMTSNCKEGCGVHRQETLLELSNGEVIYREYNGESSGRLFIGKGVYAINNNRLVIKFKEYIDTEALGLYQPYTEDNEIRYNIAPKSFKFEFEYQDINGKSHYIANEWIHYREVSDRRFGYEPRMERADFIVNK